jgi:hypothetical protein
MATIAVRAEHRVSRSYIARLAPRLGHAQAIGAITHRLCRLTWKILQQGNREERGPAVSAEAKVRARKMVREPRSLGKWVRGGKNYAAGCESKREEGCD